MFSADSISQELREIDAWLNWRYELVNDEKEKVPILATKLRQDRLIRAKVGNEKFQRPFDMAVKCLERDERLAGIGFELHEPFIGIDIDHCLNNGEPNELAQLALDMLPTYCDKSPNDGLKFIGRGSVPRGWRQRGGALEIYVSGRYFTLTGQTWPGHEEMKKLRGLAKFVKLAEPMLPPPPAHNNGTKDYEAIFANEVVERGMRNDVLKSFVGWAAYKGVPRETCLVDMLAYNHARFKPPYPDDRVQTLVDWAYDKEASRG